MVVRDCRDVSTVRSSEHEVNATQDLLVSSLKLVEGLLVTTSDTGGQEFILVAMDHAIYLTAVRILPSPNKSACRSPPSVGGFKASNTH